MKYVRIALSLVMFVFPFSFTHADDAKKCDDNMMDDYSKEQLEAADKALNAQYKKTRESLEKNWYREESKFPEQSAVDVLLTAQRAWIAYRDAECRLMAKRYDAGTAYSEIFASCIGDMTEKRTLSLKYYADDFANGG